MIKYKLSDEAWEKLFLLSNRSKRRKTYIPWHKTNDLLGKIPSFQVPRWWFVHFGAGR
jgi:hypothetical protein